MPDFSSQQEVGELERVADTLNPEDPETLIRLFHERSQNAEVRILDEDLLSHLENTDAGDITSGDFETVASKMKEMADQDPLQKRDWEGLKEKMKKGGEMDMPVIIKYGEKMHLMSGNTRLMVSRALGSMPKVVLVDVSD